VAKEGVGGKVYPHQRDVVLLFGVFAGQSVFAFFF
jgi:hypothetical protein